MAITAGEGAAGFFDRRSSAQLLGLAGAAGVAGVLDDSSCPLMVDGVSVVVPVIVASVRGWTAPSCSAPSSC